MTDDHDRCEWVNVSSGTRLPAHLGCPGQNPESRKMGCVCVCVCGCGCGCVLPDSPVMINVFFSVWSVKLRVPDIDDMHDIDDMQLDL